MRASPDECKLICRYREHKRSFICSYTTPFPTFEMENPPQDAGGLQRDPPSPFPLLSRVTRHVVLDVGDDLDRAGVILDQVDWRHAVKIGIFLLCPLERFAATSQYWRGQPQHLF